MKKTIETVVKFLIYATFFVPLVVMPSSFIFPFIVPKIIIFRSLVEIMLGLYVVLLFINWQEYKPKFTALNLAVAAFLASFAISTFVGTDAYHSFWDNHERMLGLFTILHFVAYYFICSSLFKTWTDWKWALRVFLIAGSVAMFVGLLQTQNPDLLLNQGSSRVASTLGNPIYVGGYGLFLSFVAYLLFVKEKNNIWKWACAIMGFMAFLGMFYSGTRGSMLGFVAGAGTAVVGYIVVLRDYHKTRWGLVGVAVLGVVIVGLLYGFRKTEFVSNLPAVGRAVNTSWEDIKDSPRWIAWEIAVESWKERPIFGWGPNNYFYAFNAHYNPRSLDYGYGETWFDNAHNIILNTLTVQGVFGILTYLAVFLVGAFSLIIARRNYGLDFHVTVIGIAFLAAHLVGNITVFENPTSYLYFMFWLALINAMSGCKSAENNGQLYKADKRPGAITCVASALLVVFSIFVFNIQPARANSKTLFAIKSLSANAPDSLEVMEEVLNFSSPHVDDIRSDIGRTAGQLLSTVERKNNERIKEIWELSYNELKKNIILHPLDIRNQLVLYQLAQFGYEINNAPQYLYESESFLEDALAKSPRRQQVIYSLAAVKAQFGKIDESARLLEQTIADNPKIGESYWRLAYILQVLGQDEKALDILTMAEANGVLFSEQERQIVGQIIDNARTNAQKK